MDYVVYGTGYGATLMLLGYALRTWGPKWRFAAQDETAFDRRELESARLAWGRFTTGLGAVIATCGAVLALFTFALMLLNPGDGVGVMVALIVSSAALISVAVWAWFYFERYGVWGILSTPAPLTSHQPLTYESRVRPVSSLAVAGVANGSGSFADDASEQDVTDDDAEFIEDADSEYDARFAKYISHHPDGTSSVGDVRDDELEETEVDPDVETGESHVAEAAVDTVEPDSEPESEPSDGPDTFDQLDDDGAESAGAESDARSGDEVANEQVATGDATAVVDVEVPGTAAEQDAEEGVDPAPTVISEAHEPATSSSASDVNEPLIPETRVSEPGGREDALRRLRERRAQRSQAGTDDA